MVVVEFSLVVAHFALRPFRTKRGNVFSTYLAITRLLCTALMIAFIQKINVKAIPRVVIGIVIAIIFSVSIIVVVVNLALHAVECLWKRKKGNLASSVGSSEGPQTSISEKGIGEDNSDLEKQMSPHGEHSDSGGIPDDEEVDRERPVNPTPNQTIANPYSYTPYPISPTGTSVTTMEPPSLYSRDSGTITVGSLLPRRWSFSFSQPSSPIGSSTGHQVERQNRISMTPSPLPTPSSSEHGVVLSRNTSLKAQTSHQMPRHHHDDIEEEPLAASSIP